VLPMYMLSAGAVLRNDSSGQSEKHDVFISSGHTGAAHINITKEILSEIKNTDGIVELETFAASYILDGEEEYTGVYVFAEQGRESEVAAHLKAIADEYLLVFYDTNEMLAENRTEGLIYSRLYTVQAVLLSIGSAAILYRLYTCNLKRRSEELAVLRAIGADRRVVIKLLYPDIIPIAAVFIIGTVLGYLAIYVTTSGGTYLALDAAFMTAVLTVSAVCYLLVVFAAYAKTLGGVLKGDITEEIHGL